jgi:asparagine synthetase B (glutamine-hydrolysing)
MNATILRNYAEYLSFRSFYTGHPIEQQRLPHVEDADEMVDVIKHSIGSATEPAILLSGGMDSAVLAPFMPKGATAYTIFHGKLKVNELELAESYCRKFSLKHVPIEIAPPDYLGVIDELAELKGMPLSPAEPIFYLAARRAREDGHQSVITGGGADTKLGGFPSLRTNTSTRRYERRLQSRYLSPAKVLRAGTDIQHVLSDFTYMNKKSQVVVSSRAFLRDVGVERYIDKIQLRLRSFDA